MAALTSEQNKPQRILSLEKPLTSKNMWTLVRLMNVMTVITLFLPLVRFIEIAGMTNYTLSAFHILIGTHGLAAELEAAGLNPTILMYFSVLLITTNLILTFILANKPNIWAIPLSSLIIAVTFVSASMLTWLVRSGRAELLFGFRLLFFLQLAVIILTFIGVILKRVQVETGSFKSHLALFGMLIPGIIWLLVFAYLPMPGILLAFKRYTVTGTNVLENFFKSDWVMFRNFRFLFATPDALQITRNTVLYNVTFLILGLICSVSLAIAISEIPNRLLAKFYQTTYFLPYFLSWIVVGYLTFALLNYDLGVINLFLARLGLGPVDWYMRPQAWPTIFVIANIWKYTGYGSIIYIATISGFDQEIFEAAAIDGAGKWQQTTNITLPMLVPMMTLLSILSVGRIFAADLGMFLTLPMGSGPLRSVSNVIDLYVFNSIRTGVNIGLPASAALYQSVVGFVLIMVTNYIVRRISPDNALF